LDLKSFVTVFVMIFLAELGDKTQIALMSIVAEGQKPVPALLGAILGFAVCSVVGIVAGLALQKYIPQEYIKKIAALTFIGIGIAMFWGKI
jgi:putative Ca2+/H+ antiporter (TMEM165/GDT1 family)